MRLATCSSCENAALRSGGRHRRWGRFFYAPALLLWIASPAAADSWDLIVSVDATGRVSVDSQKAVRGGAPASAAAPLQEGLAYVEVTDRDGRVLDARALPLAAEVLYDHAHDGGRLEGGALPAPKLQYHVRLPRRAAEGQRVQFYRPRRRGASRPGAFAAPSIASSDFDLEPLGAAALEAAP